MSSWWSWPWRPGWRCWSSSPCRWCWRCAGPAAAPRPRPWRFHDQRGPPMDEDVRSLIARLHAGPYRYALSVTGGGAGAAAWLLAVPGGSRTVLEVVVPYAEQALAEYLGRRPASFCSAATALEIAARAC